ncbi:uncharacterized protein LAESUDRAFT_724148 [Laetiporus sulphureus 93-53]|uniref:Uncharacterized protein n=1 Tax=Laetiporus sulphureus 93-53 TaxID=1314785 RepID=A0A165F127_9APHY|nr:uncharacterized protein LAESUDRAFT_724148 [Laetiporus sulphureus 93-53]KZT08143.1 hypothetical protein LAESUDRAFT_724148 [Laetiporus sulphureus 93-53]
MLKQMPAWSERAHDMTISVAAMDDAQRHLPASSRLLRSVTFPSITVFGCLFCTLPGLVDRGCFSLHLTHDHFHHEAFGPYHNCVKIRSLTLGDALIGSEKLMDFLAHPCISSSL